MKESSPLGIVVCNAEKQLGGIGVQSKEWVLVAASLSDSLRQRSQVAEEALPGIAVEVLRLHLTQNIDKESFCREAAGRVGMQVATLASMVGSVAEKQG